MNKTKIIILLIVIGGAFCGVTAAAIFALTHDLPQIRSLETYRPSAITRIYSADSLLLAELFVEKRDPVLLHVIPPYLTAALIATEDRNFYKHSGIDLKGIFSHQWGRWCRKFIAIVAGRLRYLAGFLLD